jgi:hypothetical protein
MRRRPACILIQLYFGVLIVATGLVAWFVAANAVMWDILIADINPDRMPPLTELQQKTVIDVTHPFVLAESVAPMVLCFAWAATTGALLSWRRVCPQCGLRMESGSTQFPD